jgi:glycosyltransferase involved in cell wall biosynthesis
MKRLRVLVSAYACNPTSSLQLHPGEDITGWRLVGQIRRFHEVWVITHTYNRSGVEQARAEGAYPDVHFHFLDLPGALRKLYKIEFGQRIYYYLWQYAAWRLARRLHKEHAFDLAHHLTFGNDWIGSFIGAFLPVPYIHGPVGGGQKTPEPLLKEYTAYGRFAERVRRTAQWGGRHDYVRRRCLRKAKAILVCNKETRTKIPRQGRSKVFYFPVNGMSMEDLALVQAAAKTDDVFRVLTAGRMHRLKGFAMAIKAFAAFARLHPNVELRIIGMGEEEARLKALAVKLGVAAKVLFIPWMARPDLLRAMAAADIFLFPSFRDGGGAVVIEAMAAGKPVIVLDSGGPGSHIEESWGVKIVPGEPEETAQSFAEALVRLYEDRALREALGRAARRRVEEFYIYDREGERMQEIYRLALGSALD